jgi:predicted nucleic acid-binding protein
VEKTVKARLSSSSNHFIDTNVLLRHANNDSGEFSSDVAAILADAVGLTPKRRLWVSSVLFAELRPSSFQPGQFENVAALARYIHSIATVVTPDTNAMLQAARLRDVDWWRPPAKRAKEEKPRRLTLGDALHLTCALWVKVGSGVEDLEFLTFDNGKTKSSESDPGTKSLPLLTLEDYCHGISADPAVNAVLRLARTRPMLAQVPLDLVPAPKPVGAVVDPSIGK